MYFTRKELETIEDQSLAPYGIHSTNTKGRCYAGGRAGIPHRITSVIATASCIPLPFVALNIKPRFSLTMKVITTARA